MSKCKSKTLKSDIIYNENQYRTANRQYQLLYVETNDGFKPCLLTASDLKKGITRASKNEEDIKPLKKWWNIFS